MKLTEEKVFILYKDILSEVEPTKSISDITELIKKKNGLHYSKYHIWAILNEMCRINLIKKIIDEPKCVRYEKTARGIKICNAKSLEEIRKR